MRDKQELTKQQENHQPEKQLEKQLEKQKVTLYLQPDVYHRLKIKAALDYGTMSSIAERAVAFYLANGSLVDEIESTVHGRTHQVYACPECATPVLLREGELLTLSKLTNFGNGQGNGQGVEAGVLSEPLVPC